MAEILVCARTLRSHADPVKDRSGSYKIGMPVVVMPDGHEWGAMERLPDFVVIRIPGISTDKVLKYISPWTVPSADPDIEDIIQRRQWVIRVDDLPLAARQKLATDGFLIIKAGQYAGQFDYTWQQVKTFFRDQKNNVDETVDI